MISSPDVIKIPRDIFRALDDYHKAIAIALQKNGRVIIEPTTEAAGVQSS
jgi:hypothetical protein